jgi:hypothetical protein
VNQIRKSVLLHQLGKVADLYRANPLENRSSLQGENELGRVRDNNRGGNTRGGFEWLLHSIVALSSAVTAGSVLTCTAIARKAGGQTVPRIAAPVIDKLVVRVIVDGAHDVFIPEQKVPDVGVAQGPCLVGGFHLAPAPADYLNHGRLKKLDIDHIFPMHCSGSNFLELAKREIPQALVLCTTGSQFTFTA